MKRSFTNDPVNYFRVAVPLFALLGIAFVIRYIAGTGAYLSPAEAKTLHFGQQYFTITLLLSLFENEMPLYYIFSHFILFLPGAVLILRAISIICYLLVFYGFFSMAKETINVRRESYHPFVILFIASLSTIPFLGYYGIRATPFVPGACLIIYSLYFFSQACIHGNTNKIGHYVFITTLALYTTYIAIPYFIMQALFLRRKHPEDETLKNGQKRIFMYFIPGLFYCLLGIIKNPWRTTDIFNCHIPFIKTLGVHSVAILFITFIAFLIPLLFYYSLGGKKAEITKNSSKFSFQLFTIVIAIISFSAFGVSHKFLNQKSAAQMERVNFVSHTKQADDGTPVIVLDSFEENDSYFFNHYLKELDLPHLIVRKPELVTNELRLGKKFDTLIPDIGTGRLKEQILNTGSVRILRGEGSKNECGSNKSDKGLNEKFLRWVGFIGDKQPDEIMGTSDKPHVFIIEKYELKDGFSPDGILLDIFVNDYRDSEKAARLIQDESFRPEMLRSYFYDPDPEKIAGASNALYAACGEDEECRDTAIEKTFSLAVIDLGVNTGHNSSGM